MFFNHNNTSTEKTSSSKFMHGIGRTCFVTGGAIAGFPIGGIIGMSFGAILGGLFAHLLERSIKKHPLNNQ